MRIIDSQVHLWQLSNPARPWRYPNSKPHRPSDFTAEDALAEMDSAGVARAIVVPPWWEGERNDIALAAAAKYPDRLRVMGLFDSEAPDAKEVLRTWRDQPGMLGFRFSARDPKYDTALTTGRMDWVWAAAEKHGVPVMMSVDPEEVSILRDIAMRHPGLKIAVDHMARKHGAKDAAAFPTLDQLLALSRLENVAVKASGLPSYSGQEYPYPAMIEAFKKVFDAFGPMRVFWGADMTKLPCSYKQAVEMFTREIPWLSGADQAAVMGDGLSRWLAWP